MFIFVFYKCFYKKSGYFYFFNFKLFFYIFSDYLDILVLNINFKNKKILF
jgi:hypothetical protein